MASNETRLHINLAEIVKAEQLVELAEEQFNQSPTPTTRRRFIKARCELLDAQIRYTDDSGK
jgi:hypothetical protein